MYIALIVLILLCSVLLICVVLVQKSKGGGLSSTFAGSNQIMGVRRTNSFIEKLTWSLAGIICVLAILTTFCMPRAIEVGSRVKDAPAEQAAPGNFNTPAPAASATPAAAPASAEAPAAAPAAQK